MTEDAGRRRGRPWGRAAVLVLLLAGAGVAVAVTGADDVDALRTEVAGAGVWAPVVFAALFAAVTLAPLPKNALSAGAGLLFGFPTAAVVVWTGAVAGAVAAFWLARLLGRDTVERITGVRGRAVDDLLLRRGFVAVLGVRLVPVLPFTAINYVSGLSALRWRDYLGGTAVGIVPGTVAYVALGAYGAEPLSWGFVAAVLALVGLTLGGAVWARRSRRRARQARS